MELSKQEMELYLPLTDSDEKAYFTTSSPFLPRIMNKIFKTGNGIIQTGNGIISPTSRPQIKKIFYNIFSRFTKEFKIDFQNRKQNYFSYFQASDQKISFTISSPHLLRSSKLIFKTGNGIIQIGFISPASRPLIKTICLQYLLHIYQGVKNDFRNGKWNYPNRKYDYFSHFKASD